VVVFIRDPSASAISERRSAPGPTRDQTIRDYGVGAQILLDLGVRDLVLLSDSEARLSGIEGYGLRITGREGLSDD
jgi:3,4-dihydroxy 2-butanone 4-phosphate synthase/GTP cyclohydrolase II